MSNQELNDGQGLNDGTEPARHFFAVLAHVRQHGLSDEVATLEARFPQAADPRLQGEMAKLLGFHFLRRGEPDRAIHWSDLAVERLPRDRDSAYNAIFARFQNGAFEDAADHAKAALQRCGEHFEFYSILCTALGALGRMDDVRRYGTRSLELKAAATAFPPHDLSSVAVPAFSPGPRNVIGFSLYGSVPKYTEGAVLNARAARFVYPGWTCRFYVDDSVSAPLRQTLRGEGAQVIGVHGMPADPCGTLWRFLVADDADVDRFILRDADSLLNVRERVAVDEWIDSGLRFHVMRDHYDQSELVLAGLWGGVRGALPPMLPAIRAWFAAQRQVIGRTADQEFLRSLWPTIRQSVLTHDSVFAFGEPRDFPAVGRLPPGCWVGCDWRKLIQ
ncbi:MAG TPA: hypothetical protein VGG99_20495 [Acetobacteraceae bacterium]|jgi:hypothetical protein